MFSDKFKHVCKHHLRRLSALAASGLTALSIGTTTIGASLLGAMAFPMAGHAETSEERIAANQALPIESNEIPGWPTGPVVSAESAILIEANTGTILYAKGIHKQEYPASTTKILTTLIAFEQCELDEWVEFSHDAVFDTPYDSNHIAMDVGQKLTVEECLNAILIRSANEVSYAIAEHISGTHWKDFAPIMNQRAKELGCVDSNFVNPNGLPDDNHYSSAYDLAMIGRAFFDVELLCKITTTPVLHLYPNEFQPQEKIEHNKMELLPGKKYAYEYLVGLKTGYTNVSRNSLVTCAQKDGMKLICVVMKDETPKHYEDTLALFQYGFSNFEKINISQTEKRYSMEQSGMYQSDKDLFGTAKPMLELDSDDYVIVPAGVAFEDLTSNITYDVNVPGEVAEITYYYGDQMVGKASLNLIQNEASFDFEAEISSASDSTEEVTDSPSPKFSLESLDYKKILLISLGVLGGILVMLVLIKILRSIPGKPRPINNRRSWKKDKRRRRSGNNVYYVQREAKDMQKLRRQHLADAKQRQKNTRPVRTVRTFQDIRISEPEEDITETFDIDDFDV